MDNSLNPYRNRTCQLPPIFVLPQLPFKILLVKEIFLARQSGMVEVGRFWANGGSLKFGSYNKLEFE